MPLSDYLVSEIRHAADRPTIDVLRARLAMRSAVEPKPAPADAVRSERIGVEVLATRDECVAGGAGRNSIVETISQAVPG